MQLLKQQYIVAVLRCYIFYYTNEIIYAQNPHHLLFNSPSYQVPQKINTKKRKKFTLGHKKLGRGEQHYSPVCCSFFPLLLVFIIGGAFDCHRPDARAGSTFDSPIPSGNVITATENHLCPRNYLPLPLRRTFLAALMD